MNAPHNSYMTCGQCHSWINLATTAYDVIQRFDSNDTVHTHHHACTRIFLLTHSGYVIEEVLHADARA